MKYSVSLLPSSLLLSLGFLVGCGENTPPQLLPIDELRWTINVNHNVELYGSDVDGDPLQFKFQIEPPPKTVTQGEFGYPTIQQLSTDKAIFQWTPGVADVGTYNLTFTVSDNEGGQDQETVLLQVSDGALGSLSLEFVEPVGAGRTFELSQRTCVEGLPVQVRADSISETNIKISLDGDVPDGLSLSPPSAIPGKQKTLSWCPTQAQLGQQLRYPITLSAEILDQPSQRVRKRYLISFEQANRANCPGRPPVIEHTPPVELNGLADYELSVQVFDDGQIKSPPLLAYIVNPPVDPRGHELSDWTISEFTSTGQDTWTASIPNLNLSEGDEVPLYYRVIATDNDDANGATCDHSSETPIYAVLVTGGGSTVTFGVCEPCTHSNQCGAMGDLCLTYDQGRFCGKACTEGESSQCPSGTGCQLIQSADGQQVTQCIPDSGYCQSRCEPDRFDEQNGTDFPLIEPGSYPDLSVCGTEPDIYVVDLPRNRSLDVSIDFANSEVDLDLAVAIELDENGTAQFDYVSDQGGSQREAISIPCLGEARSAYIAVQPYGGSIGSPYTLNLSLPPSNCVEACVDDEYETNGPALITPGIIANLQLCAGDLDEYQFEVEASSVISALITDTSMSGQLDITLYDPSGQPMISRQGGTQGVLIEERAEIQGIYRLEVKGTAPLSQASYTMDILTFTASACMQTYQCGAEQFCYPQLGCIDPYCVPGLSCGDGHSCVYPPFTNNEGLCQSHCNNDNDCRVGEFCKPLVNLDEVCVQVQGDFSFAAECSQHQDCAGDLACVPIEGRAYCISAGCDQGLPCIEGEGCIPITGGSACLPFCDSGCPDGWQCKELDGAQFCYPN